MALQLLLKNVVASVDRLNFSVKADAFTEVIFG